MDGSSATPNPIRGNSIHSNTGKGIENVSGGNGEIPTPTITSAGSAAGTSTCANCTVDVYSDNADEGRVYHGPTTTDGVGNWSFGGAVVGTNVTARVTNAPGQSSEFSAPFTCPNADADPMCDSGDPCPGNDDCDGDGWMDGVEANFIGTDPLDACRDDPSDDAWPADINNDGVSDITDIDALAGNFAVSVPPAPPRQDIGPEPPGRTASWTSRTSISWRVCFG